MKRHDGDDGGDDGDDAAFRCVISLDVYDPVGLG